MTVKHTWILPIQAYVMDLNDCDNPVSARTSEMIDKSKLKFVTDTLFVSNRLKRTDASVKISMWTVYIHILSLLNIVPRIHIRISVWYL